MRPQAGLRLLQGTWVVRTRFAATPGRRLAALGDMCAEGADAVIEEVADAGTQIEVAAPAPLATHPPRWPRTRPAGHAPAAPPALQPAAPRTALARREGARARARLRGVPWG